nr:not annotated in pYVa127/90, part of insertion element [Yersinia enterocolitica (type O:8)]
MALSSFRQRKRNKLRPVVHSQHHRVATVGHNAIQYSDDVLCWQVQIDFNRQRFTIVIIHTDQCIVHKIDRPAQVKSFRHRQR